MTITVGAKMRVVNQNAPFTGEIVTVTGVDTNTGLVYCQSAITKTITIFTEDELAFL